MNVRQLRESNGLSLQQLAAGTGIPKDRIAKWEQGKGSPKTEDSKLLDKYFRELVQHKGSGRLQEAQNGANSSQPPVLTRIGEVIKLIQYKTNPTLTIEQIAERIDYSRQTLQTLIKEGDSQKVYDRLQSEFRDVLNDKLTTSTKIPGFEMKPTGTPTVQDVTIKNLSDLAKSQQELVAEMSGKLITLVSKVIDKL